MSYLLAYLAGGFGGWLFEHAQQSKAHDRFLEKIGLGSLPFSNGYGLAMVFLLFVHRSKPTANIWEAALFCGLFFTALECANGPIGQALYGLRNWHYTGADAFCNGYAALRVAIVWILLSLLILLLLEKLDNPLEAAAHPFKK